MRDEDGRLLRSIASLAACNPFTPQRVTLEQEILGDRFEPHGETWHPSWDGELSPNVLHIQELVAAHLPKWRDELSAGSGEAELALYRDAVYYALYNHYVDELRELIESGEPTAQVAIWPTFRRDYANFLPEELAIPDPVLPEQLLAFFFQLRRAFHFVFTSIYGASPATARLRAQVWESTFGHDMQRYRHGLYKTMRDFTTLITGPSGTGKELVAHALALSQYIPFDAGREAFLADYRESYFPLNLSALSPTLVESELFGHRKGAFTGAVDDRQGWLELCPSQGTVFLDEIGEVSEEIQVKLLRVLETRSFQRLGDTRSRAFDGKIVAATNREPDEELQAGRMREDFYYRICSDQVRTPTLRAQINHSPDELRLLIEVIGRNLLAEDQVESFAGEVSGWIQDHLVDDYPWPGNFRELEQCARNVLLHGTYNPRRHGTDPGSSLAGEIDSLSLSADQLLSRYVTLAYHRTGSYVGAAARLGLDRRTVKAKVDEEGLAQLRDR
ncbi:MAG: sigma 54-interacting transcriptional regulator [Acidobacteriota bacterium]|nr:sigma 54-interacting transcriptional regulator [Acidobacteriota bacterium]